MSSREQKQQKAKAAEYKSSKIQKPENPQDYIPSQDAFIEVVRDPITNITAKE